MKVFPSRVLVTVLIIYVTTAIIILMLQLPNPFIISYFIELKVRLNKIRMQCLLRRAKIVAGLQFLLGSLISSYHLIIQSQLSWWDPELV